MSAAAVYAEYDLVVNYLALALTVRRGVDIDFALWTGGILPDAKTSTRGKWSPSTVDAMRQLREEGYTYKAIGERYGQTSGAIYRILVYREEKER